ncbi:hypothetical protein TRIATDRAFT_41118 [Trichoderma atroviride IMI 206040]|uniref:BZIP domain-containing protein n=1 Tax=Hypocrea atroviridis (strain ATCC 20476 / IMI 206040) TaxID=452589 RepID=G9NTE8_HYPAI|nr:uncharacterized protein TRIATDRAFT_41118 [Trichoderma atroviride IMI 206040]EHK45990.1 hypothetical protein TRIATDRAFT_41118 [Trichoderma atroviride IMI 206040]
MRTGNIRQPKVADANAPARRPGRPRMKDSLPIDPNDNSPRSRMRLAQRSYRNRKANELTAAKERADSLEKALNSTLDEFIKLHQMLLGKQEYMPADFLMQLHGTATNIIGIAKNALADNPPEHAYQAGEVLMSTDSDEDEDDAIDIAAPINSGSSYPKPPSISQRILRACLDIAADRLKLPRVPFLRILPALLLPLQFESEDNILRRAMQYLSLSGEEAHLEQERYSAKAGYLPKMMRLIEGQTHTLVPRKPQPDMQRLQFGCTRTVISTAVPDLQGEWLEPLDVEEYLEQRGIFVREEAPDDDLLNLAIPAGSKLSATMTNVNETDAQPSDMQNQTYTNNIPDTSNHDELGIDHDYGIFDHQRDATTAFAASLWDVDGTGISPENTSMCSSEQINITINLDTLVHKLVSKAVCLGACPGIRRAHVDEAIRGSVVWMQETYK